MTAPHPAVAAAFDALDGAGTRWCVLRGEDDLASPHGDVDLLVAWDDLPAARAALSSVGFVPLPAWGYGSHAFFLAYDPDGDGWVKLDVVTELAFGPDFELATHTEAACLDRCGRVDGVRVLAEDDAFWSLLLHCLLDKDGPEAHDRRRLHDLAGRVRGDGPVTRMAASVMPVPATTVIEHARRGEWSALVELAPGIAAAWRRRRRREVARRRRINATWRLAAKVLRPLWRPGVTVAVLAPDGAGKTTVVDGARATFYFPSRAIYMGLYRPERSRRVERVPGLGLATRLCRQRARWIAGRYHARRGRLVLFDRYTHDALVSAPRRLTTATRARRWLLARACPPPDVTILLDAPGDVLFARKGEKTPAALEQERARYRAAVAGLPAVTVLDASRDADLVRRDVIATIWRAYAARWGRWRSPAPSPRHPATDTIGVAPT